jgi:hypothetical protein
MIIPDRYILKVDEAAASCYNIDSSNGQGDTTTEQELPPPLAADEPSSSVLAGPSTREDSPMRPPPPLIDTQESGKKRSMDQVDEPVQEPLRRLDDNTVSHSSLTFLPESIANYVIH